MSLENYTLKLLEKRVYQLKAEARILVSKCTSRLCASIVTRGRGFDTIILALNCKDLCERLEREGYIYELRYSIGDCSCNLPQPPRTSRIPDILDYLEKLLGTTIEFLELKG